MRRLLFPLMAWLLWLLSISILLATLWITIAYPFSTRGDSGSQGWLELLVVTPPLLAYTLVGLVLSIRRPNNPIGWLFSLAGICIGLGYLTDQYFWVAIVQAPGTLPANPWLYWAGTNTFLLGLGAILTSLMLFPDGRLPSPRWLFLPGLLAGGIVANFLSSAFKPGDIGYGIENPAGSLAVQAYSDLLEMIALICLMGTFLGVLVIVALRYRHSRGVERLQIKWFLYTTAWAASGFIAATLLFNYPLLNSIAWLTGFVGLGLTPVAVAIAILRYRLYDIDIIIRRTLVYGGLTITLAVVYFALVTLLQELFSKISNQQSTISIVLSTLAIAALFNPLRKRIQNGIDHRFYRRRYNAEQTLQAFAASLRNEVDLDQLSSHLVAIVQETMQPESVTLWLKEQVKRRPGAG